MNTLSATTLFTIWERGRRLLPSGRGHTILHAAGIGGDTLGRLTVGQRDALLMDLRGRTFGGQVASVADCPACAARMDVSFGLQDIWAPPSGDPALPVRLSMEEYRIEARPPNVDDLTWLERCDPSIDRRSALLQRCVLDAQADGQAVDTGELPEPVVAYISSALAEADPQAEIHLALACDACGHTWTALFDIMSFFWQELENWVWRIARDVDTLASRYGWTEADILAMSPDRRALYLEMVRA